jgi:hypothetical protein
LPARGHFYFLTKPMFLALDDNVADRRKCDGHVDRATVGRKPDGLVTSNRLARRGPRQCMRVPEKGSASTTSGDEGVRSAAVRWESS